MHLSSASFIALVGLAVITASPVPQRSLSTFDKGIKLLTKDNDTNQQTTDTPRVTGQHEEEQTTAESTAPTVESISVDLANRSRHIRSITTESMPEETTPEVQEITTQSFQETTTEIVLDSQKIQSANWSLLILQNALDIKMEDLQTEADFQSFNEELAIINRPVLEENLTADSAACINIQGTIIKIVEVLDAFHPYTEAIGSNYITVTNLRYNMCMLVRDIAECYVIPTSGSTIPVENSTQDTIFTLMALTFQNRIIQNVINNLDLCQ
ncbi:hypothetical protein ACF0H5_016313 [Mactra antiquata]